MSDPAPPPSAARAADEAPPRRRRFLRLGRCAAGLACLGLASAPAMAMATVKPLSTGPVAAPPGSAVTTPVRASDAGPNTAAAPDSGPAGGVPNVGTGLAVTDVLVVMQGLVDAGVDPETAAGQVAALSAEDLAVFASHPGMLQSAGAMDAQTTNIILGLALLGGIIALAAASSGGGSIMVN